MIDHFSIGLTHLLMALAIWRLMTRDDLDREPESPVDGAASQSFTERRLRPRGRRHKATTDA